MEKKTKTLHQQRKKLWDASMANHEKYIDRETGLFKQEFVEKRGCPVCGAEEYLEIFNKEGGTYVKCPTCQMVYLNPVLKDEFLNEYYTNNHDVQAEIVESDNDFYRKIYTLGLDQIAKNTPAGKILDMGCSSGGFLDVAKEKGWETYGVELNAKEAQHASKKHTVYNELIQNISFETKFDVITLWDVFEHLKNGKYYLDFLQKLLNPKGVIFLQIPSSDSLAAKILQEKCNMFDGLEHVNLYNRSTIEKIADSCGLEVLSMSSVISEIGVINNYLSYEDPYFGGSTNTREVPGLINEEEMHKTLQGYKLQVVLGVSK